MKRAVKWLWLLTKRQFRKRTFLALLVLIPALVFGYAALAQGQSGAVTVALSWHAEDGLAEQLCRKLQEESQLIRFIPCDEAGAEYMVRIGKADAAWIFPENTAQALERFAAGTHEPFIRVVEREQTTTLLLAREKLSAAVFTAGAELLYEQHLRQQVPVLEAFSREALMEYYHNTMMSGNLFDFEDVAGMQDRLEDQQSYLLSPLRGLLGTVVTVCAMACAMYACRDEERGVFLWVAQPHRPWIELAGQLIALVSVLFVTVVSLALAGLAGSLWQELPLALVYALCCAAFGMLLRQLLQKAKVIALALPLLSIAMLVVCPVFFGLHQMRLIALALPPTYFINGISDSRYLLGGLIYSGVCFFLQWLISRLRTK